MSVLYTVVAAVLLVFMAGWLLLANAIARQVAVLLLGARGSPFTFGAPRWAWARGGLTRKMCVAAAGAAGSYLAAASFFAVALLGGGVTEPDEASMRVEVGSTGPAARAGIRDGDRIVLVEGKPVTNWNELKAAVGHHAGDPISIELEREGTRTDVVATPDARGKIMIGPWGVTRSVGVATALGEGCVAPAEVMLATCRGFARMFAGTERTDMAGPVGIVRETSHTAERNGRWAALRLAGALGAYFWPLTIVWSLIMSPGGGGRRRRTSRGPRHLV
jgi:regulator of sigma E protease